MVKMNMQIIAIAIIGLLTVSYVGKDKIYNEIVKLRNFNKYEEGGAYKENMYNCNQFKNEETGCTGTCDMPNYPCPCYYWSNGECREVPEGTVECNVGMDCEKKYQQCEVWCDQGACMMAYTFFNPIICPDSGSTTVSCRGSGLIPITCTPNSKIQYVGYPVCNYEVCP